MSETKTPICEKERFVASVLYSGVECDVVALDVAEKLETELAEAKTELAELKSLFDLQHRRSIEAMKMWQDAHNEPDVWPDLGKLLEWLMTFTRGCHSCIHGPRMGGNPRRCAGCSFAMKNSGSGKNLWEPGGRK